MTAAAPATRMPSGTRLAMVMEHPPDHPGLTAGEIARALGLRRPMLDTMRGLARRPQVVAVAAWIRTRASPAPALAGRPARRRTAAAVARGPAGRRAPTRARPVGHRARRARARGLHVEPGAEPPSLRDRPAAAADLGGAACRTEDPEPFFPPEDERPADREARVARAMAVCHGCPVQARCYAAAVANGERWGIWGGVDFTRTRRQRRAS